MGWRPGQERLYSALHTQFCRLPNIDYMTRSTLCEATTRRSRIVGRSKPFVLLLVAGLQACGDTSVAPIVTEPAPAPPVIPAPPAPPAAPQGLRLDSAALRSLASHAVALGERVSVAADSTSTGSVSDAEVSVGDTTIVGIDGEGTLQGLAIGQSWIRWNTQQASDSALVTVATPGDPVFTQQPYIAPVAPRKAVDVRYPSARTRGASVIKSWRVAAGADLQAALNAAQPGDEVVLESGATFTGNFVLPAKQGGGSEWIVVRSDVIPVGAGTRVTPALAANSARIVTPNQDPALRTLSGARRWRLVGLQIEHAQNAIYNYGIVVLGRGDEKNVEAQPSDIVLDRMYIHGSTVAGNSRCVAFNGRSLAVIDSWIAECHAKGQDAQGVGGWNGGGPFLIENNFIEASGQGVMFGGADPAIADVSPSDITIRRNHIYKPTTWAKGRWTVKAAFELKHGRRVLFESNIVENHWIDAQVGFAILLQTLADNNSSWAWTTVQDVMIRNNVIRNSTSGANILARVAYNGGTLPTNPTSRIAIVNNLWMDVGLDPVTGEQGRLVQLLRDLNDVTVLHNTFTMSQGRAGHAVSFDGQPGSHTIIANNVFPASSYGVFGSGKGSGNVALSYYAPDGVFTGNVVPGQSASVYPANNYFPISGISGVVGSDTFGTGCSTSLAWRLLANIPASAGADCSTFDVSLRNVLSTVPPL